MRRQPFPNTYVFPSLQSEGMSVRYISRISERRKALGWSLAKLAAQLQLHGFDISATALNNLERGERRLDPDELVFFAAALGVDPNHLVGWDEFRKQKGG